MSTTETDFESIKTMDLKMSLSEHPDGMPAVVGTTIIGENAIVIRPRGHDDDGQGNITLKGEIHLGVIDPDVAASLLRDIADMLDGANGVEVSDD